jgi:hypothetical protein
LNTVSSRLGLRITQIIKYAADEPTFKMVINGSTVDFGNVENITNWSRFQNKVAAHIGKGIPVFKGNKWVGVWELILAAAVVQDIADGGYANVSYANKLRKYLDTCSIEDISTMETAEKHITICTDTYKDKTVIHFSLDEFYRWLKIREGDNIQKGVLARVLKGNGVSPMKVNITDPETDKRTSRFMWTVDETVVFG